MARPAWPVAHLRDLIDRVLEETGASQAALAALVPMDASQMSRWRSGKSRPSFSSLESFADAVKASYPHITVTKREILSGGGYGETLGPEASSESPGSPTAQIGPDASWAATPPDDLSREQLKRDWNVDWDSLTLAERHAWHTPMVDLRTRYMMAATAKAFLAADAEAYRMAHSLDRGSNSQFRRGANGG